MQIDEENLFNHSGYCPICETDVTFSSTNQWFRDHLFCSRCGSIPRERALMKVISDYYPNFRDLDIHESSPGGRGVSIKLHQECSAYTATQFYPHIMSGDINQTSGYRCENLEKLTFQDNSFDLFITQDVMEHIFKPELAFKEIARVLKPGGAHIFTVPLVNIVKKSERWASRNDNGDITFHYTPEYHGNPVVEKVALVTMHWGCNNAGFITETAKIPITIIMIDNIDFGIRAKYIDALPSVKCAIWSESTNV